MEPIYCADAEFGLIQADFPCLSDDQQLFIQLEAAFGRELRQRHPLHLRNQMPNQEIELDKAVPAHVDRLRVGVHLVVAIRKRVNDMLVPG